MPSDVRKINIRMAVIIIEVSISRPVRVLIHAAKAAEVATRPYGEGKGSDKTGDFSGGSTICIANQAGNCHHHAFSKGSNDHKCDDDELRHFRDHIPHS